MKTIAANTIQASAKCQKCTKNQALPDPVELALLWASQCFGSASPEALAFTRYLVTQVRGQPWLEELPAVFASAEPTPPAGR
jgi:hypothetical protein